MSAHIDRVHPLAGVEGGRVTILGTDLLSLESGSPVPHFDQAPSRPLIASAERVVCPVPEEGVSGFLRMVWPEREVQGPYFEVAGKLADELHPVANPVVDQDGFVITTYSGTRGQAPPNGVSVFRIPPEGGVEPLVSELMNPTGLALSPDGTLFISCRNDGTIRKLSRTGDAELFTDGLGIATGIAFDREGILFVGDRSGGIFAVEPKGSIRRFARLPASVAAYHLAFGPDGDLFVTAPTLSNDDPIYRVSPGGTVRRHFEHLARPQGLAFDRDGQLYVVAIYRGERGIFRIPADGAGEVVLAVAGENLVGLTFDGGGRMIIASTGAIYRLGWV
jgi:sugar lactone lactonase YvrE